MTFIDRLFGDQNKKILRTLEPLLIKTNQQEAVCAALNDEQLRNKTKEFRDRLLEGATVDGLLPEAFAVVREAARRTIGQRHFDVQILGAIALHKGMIAEMRTGEGKTLTATLALYLNALEGRGAHVVTVNDYLAKRDMVWMGQIYDFLGLTIGCLQHEQAYRYKKPTHDVLEDAKRDTRGGFEVIDTYLERVSRREAYAADITYGTNNEYGFDYLRDNMVYELGEMVQRQRPDGSPDLHYAIVDEVDSILIDEARTPLIISAPAEQSEDMYTKCAHMVTRLTATEDYIIDEKLRTATLTEQGITKMEKMLGVENLYVEGGVRLVHHVEQALRAHALYHRDKDYVVKDGEIIIVDEFTGRLMHGRRYSEGLHQAIEAQEGVAVRRESLTLATITFQNLFRMYDKLAGMTGTAATEKEEFQKIYNLDVATIPTNKPAQRTDHGDRVYKTEEGKIKALIQEVTKRHDRGQPILIGTISIEKNEVVAEALRRAGIEVEILNAKNHEREATIIAQAGRKGAVTIATNMAGRGVDIILGGNPPVSEEHEEIRKLGGLFVLGTERHESRRIDNQLRGRSGRQGDPGETQFLLSLEDDLLRIFGSDKLKSLMERLGVPEDMPIEHGLIGRSIEQAQKRVEGHNFDIRKHLLQYDDVLNKHRDTIYRRRRAILVSAGQDDPTALHAQINTMIEEELEQMVLFHTQEGTADYWDIHALTDMVRTLFAVSVDDEKQLLEQITSGADKESVAQARTVIVQFFMQRARALHEKIEAQITETVRAQGNTNPHPMREVEKQVMLRAIDALWIDHLEAMNYLRTGVGMRGYGQLDPLVEYQREGYRMFMELLQDIRKNVTYAIFKLGTATAMAGPSPMQVTQQLSGAAKTMGNGSSIEQTMRNETAQRQGDTIPEKPRDAEGEKIGRNDLCPCGSGLKYKKCHGK